MFRETLAKVKPPQPPRLKYIEKTLLSIASFWDRSIFQPQSDRKSFRRGLARGSISLSAPLQVSLVFLFLIVVSFCTDWKSLLVCGGFMFFLLLFSFARGHFTGKSFIGAGFGIAVVSSILLSVPASINLFSHATSPVFFPLVHLQQGYHVGPVQIPQTIGLTSQGMIASATTILRILISSAATLWLLLSLGWVDLFRALRTLGVPALVLQIAAMMLIFTHILIRRTEEIYLAKKSRRICYEKHSASRSWVALQISSTWELSLRLMEEVHQAMSARGFRGESRFAKVH